MILWLVKLVWQTYSPRGRWSPEYIQHVDYVKHVGRQYLHAKMPPRSGVREMRTLFLAALLQGIRITRELRHGPSSPTLEQWMASRATDGAGERADHVKITSKGPSYPLSIFNGQTVAYKVAGDLFADIPSRKWDKGCVEIWNRAPSCDTIKIVVEPS